MTPAAQAKILRVIQEQEFERVGGNQAIRTDVRLIAATNRDLKEMLDTDTLRQDLYYRLSVVTIDLPPLRERGEDVAVLADYFLHRFRRDLNKDVREISTPALDILKQYSWPGNVRELQSVIKQACFMRQARYCSPSSSRTRSARIRTGRLISIGSIFSRWSRVGYKQMRKAFTPKQPPRWKDTCYAVSLITPKAIKHRQPGFLESLAAPFATRYDHLVCSCQTNMVNRKSPA